MIINQAVLPETITGKVLEASSDAEMAAYAAVSSYIGKYCKFTGSSSSAGYVNGQLYKIISDYGGLCFTALEDGAQI